MISMHFMVKKKGLTKYLKDDLIFGEIMTTEEILRIMMDMTEETPLVMRVTEKGEKVEAVVDTEVEAHREVEALTEVEAEEEMHQTTIPPIKVLPETVNVIKEIIEIETF